MSDDIELPVLPKPALTDHPFVKYGGLQGVEPKGDFWNAADMADYARAAILADRERSAVEWLAPGPVTPDHPMDCLIVLESLRQSDGDWWVAGSTFFDEQKPVAWCADTPENRAALLSHLRKRVGREGQ